jgi:hypothetical protein
MPIISGCGSFAMLNGCEVIELTIKRSFFFNLFAKLQNVN